MTKKERIDHLKKTGGACEVCNKNATHIHQYTVVGKECLIALCDTCLKLLSGIKGEK